MPVSADNFGLLIAYILPGFVCLWALQPLVPAVRAWLAAQPSDAPSVGGFLFVTLASAAAGMLVGTVRWAVLDQLHHRTGIRPPRWNLSRLTSNLAAFRTLVEWHYRYYEFHGNMLVAVTFLYAVRLFAAGRLPGEGGWTDLLFLATATVLLLGSRDTLRKYYARSGELLAGKQGTLENGPTSASALRGRGSAARRNRPAVRPSRRLPPTGT
jgi:hypothetical protein